MYSKDIEITEKFLQFFSELEGSVSFSFSGGRTSAMMTYYGVKVCKLLEIPYGVCFCNTGREHEETYKFIENFSKFYEIPVTWIEALIPKERRTRAEYKIVDFETASRDGEPFRRAVEKYGIANINYPHCTRELKTRISRQYRKDNGFKYVSIGIRADEFDRVSEKTEAEKIIYPLIYAGIQKADVLEFFKEQPFDLNIPEELGNCVTCFKKSIKKLALVAKTNPEFFDFDRELEKDFSMFRPESQGRPLPTRIYRGNRTVDDIFRIAYGEEIPEDYTQQSGCSESCEAF